MKKVKLSEVSILKGASNIEALKNQLAKDKQTALAYIVKHDAK